jgi:hypothetical protein
MYGSRSKIRCKISRQAALLGDIDIDREYRLRVYLTPYVPDERANAANSLGESSDSLGYNLTRGYAISQVNVGSHRQGQTA